MATMKRADRPTYRADRQEDLQAIGRIVYNSLADNKAHDGDIWAERKLVLAYCLYIRQILKKIQQKGRLLSTITVYDIPYIAGGSHVGVVHGGTS